MAYNFNFENFYQNDAIDFSLTIFNVVDDVSTAKNDLNSFRWKMDLKPKKNNTNSILSFDSSAGGITMIDASNALRFIKSSAELSSIKPGTYYYDLQAIDASLNNFTYMFGLFTFNGDVTR